MKKIIALALAVILVLGLAACGSKEAGGTAEAKKEDSKIKATFVGVMQGGSCWGAAQKGFEDACKELGWDGQYVAPSTPNDTIVMVDLMSTAVTNGCNVLIGTFYDTDVFGDVAKQAFENGVYVASTNCNLGKEYQNFWIGTDPIGMGTAQAKALVELAGDKEVCAVYMQTNATATTQNEQYAAMCEYLKDYPKGIITMHPEQDDVFELRKELPNCAILGGMPVSLLGNGTVKECVDYTKRLCDELGHDGGFILCQDKMVSFRNDAKPENVKAVCDFVREYRP